MSALVPIEAIKVPPAFTDEYETCAARGENAGVKALAEAAK